MSDWDEMRADIVADLRSRPTLRDPARRLSSLDAVERNLDTCFPGFRDDLGILERAGKQKVIDQA